MGDIIFLFIILPITGLLILLYIVHLIDRGVEGLKYKMPQKWVIKSFCDEDIWYSRINRKLYEFIINLNKFIKDIFSRFRKRFFIYTVFISTSILIYFLVLKILERLEFYSNKLIDIKNRLVNFNIEFFNFKIEFSDLKWILLIAIGLLTINKCYRRNIRKNLKESYYREVVDEYLKVKDLILKIFYVNIYNEKILYEIMKYKDKELMTISDNYNKSWFNYLCADIFNAEYTEVEKNIGFIIPRINELIEYKFESEDLIRFGEVFNSKSKNVIIYSIDKKLHKLLSTLALRSGYIYVIDKEYIIKTFMKNHEKIMIKTFENSIYNSINKRIEVLKKIEKIDKKIGLFTKEIGIYEFLEKVK